MPIICIGPVCIPISAVLPILLWVAKPVWVRLPPPVREAIATRWSTFYTWCRAKLGLKPPPEPTAEIKAADAASAASLQAGTGTVVGLHSDAEWEAALALTRSQGVPMVVDFTAAWCGPCQEIAPFFASLAKDYGQKGAGALFVKVDVDELEDVSQTAGVVVMPTFQVYKKGELSDTATGAIKEKLKAMVVKATA